MLIFLVAPFLVVAVKPCKEWIPIIKNLHSNMFYNLNQLQLIISRTHLVDFGLYRRPKSKISLLLFCIFLLNWWRKNLLQSFMALWPFFTKLWSLEGWDISDIISDMHFSAVHDVMEQSSYILEFSAHRMFFFDLWSKWP